MKESENFPNCRVGNMLVISLTEFRKGVVEMLGDLMQSDSQDMLMKGRAGCVATMLACGAENMGISEMIEAGDCWLNCTMDCDESLDGIIIYDDTINNPQPIVAISDFK